MDIIELFRKRSIFFVFTLLFTQPNLQAQIGATNHLDGNSLNKNELSVAISPQSWPLSLNGNAMQEAYQLRGTGGQATFENDKVIWNNGEILCDQSLYVSYTVEPEKEAIINEKDNRSKVPAKVKIQKKQNGFSLLVNGKPYFIKGAVGSDYLEKLKQYGGNAIRTGSKKEILDKAHSLGLMALVNLPVRAERDGMNYDDIAAVKLQHEKVMDIVRKTKNHPAVMMWALGNELDFIEANVKLHYNTKVWNAVNALAKEIHAIDPNHPVMTVVGSINKEKINDLLYQCPQLDLLGVNEYGDLLNIPQWLKKYGWKKPYAVTEWGPTGFWQVPKTPWKVPVEETSSMKATKYKERYEKAIAADKNCLGSYVFLWRQHQERTHTWFGMFDANGLETEAVDVMQYVWSGRWPANRTPTLDSAKIENKNAYAGIYLQKNNSYFAEVWATDRDTDTLQYTWEILKEGSDFPYGGNGEKKPATLKELVSNNGKSKINFTSPDTEGAYRLFVYVYDGMGNWATANLPFYVSQ